MPEQLTPHFALSELDCRCGCKTPLKIVNRLRTLALSLEAIRAHFGKPVTVNSGYRCPAHNAAIKPAGKPNSQHLLGNAADIVIAGVSPREIAKYAETLPMIGGLEDYSSFTHVDIRPRIAGKIARWNG